VSPGAGSHNDDFFFGVELRILLPPTANRFVARLRRDSSSTERSADTKAATKAGTKCRGGKAGTKCRGGGTKCRGGT
jgi:hypothetical protein